MNYLKRFVQIILVLILAVVLLWIIALSGLKTEGGQQWAMNRVIHFIEHQTNTQVTIGNIDVLFPFTVQINDIAIRKEQQDLIYVQQLDIGCQTSRLIEGQLICPLLYAKDIYVSKMASQLKANKQPIAHSRWDDYILPVYLRVQNILVEDLHVAPELIDQFVSQPQLAELLKQSVFQLQGNINNNPFRRAVTANLSLFAIDPQGRHQPVQLILNIHRHHLALALHLSRFPLASFIEHPLSIDAAYYASAPIDTWQKTLEGLDHEEPITGNFKINLAAEQEDPLLMALIGPDSQLKGKYSFIPFQHLEMSDLKIGSPCCQLDGQLTITQAYEIQGAQLIGQLHQLEKLAAWIPQLPKGLIDFQASFFGPVLKPSVSLELTSPLLYLNEEPFHHLTAHLTTELVETVLKGNAQVEISHDNIPYHLHTNFAWNPQHSLAFPQFQFYVLGTELQGQALLNLSDLIWDANLKGYSNDLALLSPLTGIPAHGQAELHLNLHPEQIYSHQRAQHISGRLHCRQFQWADLHAEEIVLNTHLLEPFYSLEKRVRMASQVEGIEIQWQDWQVSQLQAKMDYIVDSSAPYSLTSISAALEAQNIKNPHVQAAGLILSGHIENPFQASPGELNWTARQIDLANGYHLNELSGSTKFNPQELLWPFQVKASGQIKEELGLTASGYWHIKDQLIETRVNEFSGQFGTYPFHLLNPFTFIKDQANWQISDLNMQWHEGQIQAQILVNHNHFNGQFAGKQIPSNLIRLFEPHLPIEGKLSLTAQLEGPLDHLQGQAHLFLHRIQITEQIFAKNPFIEGEAHFNLTGSGINVRSIFNGIGRNPVVVEGVLPLVLSLSPASLQDRPELPFQVRVQAEGELDPYLHLFYNDTTNLSGQTKISLVLQGKLKEPQIQGSVDLYNGSYESLGTGAVYKNIQAHLEGDGSKLVLRHFSAEDKNQGSITVSGVVHLDSQHQFPFEFHVQPKHMYIMDSDYAAIAATGPLVLTGNRKQAKLQGTLTTDSAAIHMEEVLPSQVKSVEIKYVNVPQGETIPTYAQSKENSWLDLDIKLNIGSLEIKGKSLSSDWKGAITINGHMENLLLNGDLRVVKGEYNFNGKVFTISQGNIHFAGPIDKKTTLYAVASKDIDRIKAEIIVKGPTDKLAISFRSNPPLSQREVLSYILFNRGISDITTDQGTQLTQSFMSLNSASTNDQTSTDFLTRLRNNMGVDRLDFGSSSTGPSNDMGLQIGKYLTEGIFFSVNKSMNDSSGYTGAIEANLRKNVKAEVQVDLIGEDRQGKMSLKWKKDY